MAWWVVAEGTAGQIIGDIAHDLQSGGGPAGVGSFFTVKQSAAKPSGAAAGPFATQAQAQAKADALNGDVTTATQPNASNLGGVGAFFGRLSQASTWIRVGEVVIGLILVGIGLNAMLKGKPFQVVTKAAGVAGKAAIL